MRTCMLASLVGLAAALLPDGVSAHGGRYGGPGDVVPPNSGGAGGPRRTTGPSGPTTPRPGGPSVPGPVGPATPGSTGPTSGPPTGPGGAGGPRTGAGIVLDDDLTRWEFWWEFNKDPFIDLKAAIHLDGTVTNSDIFYMGASRRQASRNTMRPTQSQIVDRILPALNHKLEGTDQRDIVSSCMVAMAKIGQNTDQIRILPIFKERLTERDQEIRETAALAMGIARLPDAVADLIDLVEDTVAGRKLCGRSEVDDRTRAFAAYGLGLIAYASSNHDVKSRIFGALQRELANDSLTNRNIPVALINAMGLLRPDPADAKGKDLLVRSLETLETFYARELGSGQQQIQAHCPPAMAKLLEDYLRDDHLGGDAEIDERIVRYKDLFVADLSGKGEVERSSDQITQSAAVALGRLCAPYDDERSRDAKYSEALTDYYAKGKDKQTRYFSLMALGKIGGEANRKELLIALEKGSKALEKPWAAMALGVFAFEAMEETGARAEVDSGIGRALTGWLQRQKNPSTTGALAVALGLCRYTEAADQLRALLEKHKNQDELAGYLCIGLALMGDDRAIEPIRRLVEGSVRRPLRLLQAAVALGKLGDKSVTDTLQRAMTEGPQNLAKMSAIASALGFIGDRRTVDGLVAVMNDESLTDLSQAFAAVALGRVADKEPLPWNTRLRVDMNYRAAVETLTNQVDGVLDIL